MLSAPKQHEVIDIYLPKDHRWPAPGDTLIREYPEALDAETCAEIVRLFEASDKRVPGSVGPYGTGGGTVDPEVKSSLDLDVALEDQEVWLPYVAAMRDAVGRAVCDYIDRIISLHFIRSPYGIINTGLQLQGYQPNGQDGFKVHIDRASLESSRRELACLIYLNDVDEGGETCFPIQRKAVKPEVGKVVVFPAGFTHPHEARTPVSGPKLVASCFMVYATKEAADAGDAQDPT